MFYLSGRGDLCGYPKSDRQDEFGWYFGDQERIEDKIYNDRERIVVNGTKPTVVVSSSLSSSTSMLTCTDSEEPEDYSLVENFSKRENVDADSKPVENIEMHSFNRPDDLELDVDVIERDADRVFTSSMRSTRDRSDSFRDENGSGEESPRAICYTPERLVRSQEYRILTPSPRCFGIPRSTPNGIDDASPKRYRGHRRRLGDLIDAKQFGEGLFRECTKITTFIACDMDEK